MSFAAISSLVFRPCLLDTMILFCLLFAHDSAIVERFLNGMGGKNGMFRHDLAAQPKPALPVEQK